MEPIFGTPASESPSLSPERLVTTDVLVVEQIEEDEATTERNFAFYASKLHKLLLPPRSTNAVEWGWADSRQLMSQIREQLA